MARLPPYHSQLALLVKSAPSGPGWLHELKYDGYRIGCRIERGRVTLLSRRGNDWTMPLAFREACRLGLEGIVSKRRDQPYLLGKRQGWLKTKCVERQEFVIGGFTDPEGSRQGIGALLVGYFASPEGVSSEAGERLVCAGKVGTGFTAKAARDLRTALERIEVRTCPFTPQPPGWLGRHAHRVAPTLVGEVEFTEWTDEGKIRHPSFQGLRADKRPKDVRRERAR